MEKTLSGLIGMSVSAIIMSILVIIIAFFKKTNKSVFYELSIINIIVIISSWMFFGISYLIMELLK